MIPDLRPLFRRIRRDQRGATFIFAAVATMMLVGFGALTVDLGNAYRVRRQLQNAADAAALAGAVTLYNGGAADTAESTAGTWSASSGGKNVITGVSVSTTATTVSCTGATGSTCTANSSGPNGIKVTETGAVPTFFGRLLGVDSIPISATSYAIGNTSSGTCSTCGGLSQEADVIVVLDGTESMGSAANSTSDPACANKTNEQCAVLGVQAMLTDLTAPSSGVGGATVGLMTFPGLQTAAEAAYEYCSGGTPSSSNIAQYNASNSAPFYNAPYYLIYPTYSSLTTNGGFDGSFKSSSGSLNTSDNLVIAAYGNSGSCNGLTAYGGAGTSLAIAMQEGTALLQNDGRKGAEKYLVILSDGDANSNASMPSNYSITDPTTNITYTAGNDECHQAIAASRIAQAAGITVVALGFGEETTNADSGSGDGGGSGGGRGGGRGGGSGSGGGSSAGCNTDTGTANLISPCTTMMTMASVGSGTSASPQFFYSDAASSGSNACPSPANPTFTSVNQIFKSLANVIIGGNGTGTGSAGGLPHLIPAT